MLRCHLPGGLTDVVSTNANAPVVNYEDIRTVDTSADGQFVAYVANTDSGGVNTAIWLVGRDDRNKPAGERNSEQ